MDYSLLKEIEPNLGPSPDFGFRLTSTPSRDYVNPGVGQIAQLYSLFVPVHPNNAPHLIEKVNDVLTQEGEGEEQNDVESTSGTFEPSQDSDMAAPEDSNFSERKRKNMAEGVNESFLHPKKIKIGEILLPKKEPKKLLKKEINGKKESKITHKFRIV
jgi:hypothetical protein